MASSPLPLPPESSTVLQPLSLFPKPMRRNMSSTSLSTPSLSTPDPPRTPTPPLFSSSHHQGVPVIAEVGASAVVGVDPKLMGFGPVPAIRQVLEKTGQKLEDIDLVEINEAFAAQVLAVSKELGLPLEKCGFFQISSSFSFLYTPAIPPFLTPTFIVFQLLSFSFRLNIWGGATAIGHPLGASGVRIANTLARQLTATGKKQGIASACIGGGQGIALQLLRVEE